MNGPSSPKTHVNKPRNCTSSPKTHANKPRNCPNSPQTHAAKPGNCTSSPKTHPTKPRNCPRSPPTHPTKPGNCTSSPKTHGSKPRNCTSNPKIQDAIRRITTPVPAAAPAPVAVPGQGSPRPLSIAVVLTSLLVTSAADARPNIIIFGGGWAAPGNQASLEVHTQALATNLAALEPLVLFGGPNAGAPSIQILASKPDPAGEILGLVFEQPTLLDVAYRPTTIRPSGPATKAALLDAIARPGREALVVFGVGHGSLEPDQPARLDLWGPPQDALTRPQLAEALARLKRPVALFLGQCHSGAFTDLGDGNSDRCVFAAIPADREASGCTPDIQDPSARSYMALVADALTQKSADLDGDGAISLAEAHSYARVHDATIDVPVSSSEAFLRQTLGDRAPRVTGMTLSALTKGARPTERAVLALVPDAKTAGDVEQQFTALSKQLDALDGRIADDEARATELKRTLRYKLFEHWPELANPYHPRARQLLAGDAKDVVALVEAQPQLAELRALQGQLGPKLDRYNKLDRRSARLERWLRAAENIAYERALTKSASQTVRRRYKRITACEAIELR